MFSVVVPAVLPVTVDQNGKVYVSNAETVNHSTAAVQVSSVTLTAENGWTLVPYASDMSHAKVDSNQIGFKINSAQTSKTGSTEQFELTSPWQINEEESLTLSYDAVVSALSQPVTNANILCVRAEDLSKPWVAKFVQCYHSPEVKAFVEKRFNGGMICAW